MAERRRGLSYKWIVAAAGLAAAAGAVVCFAFAFKGGGQTRSIAGDFRCEFAAGNSVRGGARRRRFGLGGACRSHRGQSRRRAAESLRCPGGTVDDQGGRRPARGFSQVRPRRSGDDLEHRRRDLRSSRDRTRAAVVDRRLDAFARPVRLRHDSTRPGRAHRRLERGRQVLVLAAGTVVDAGRGGGVGPLEGKLLPTGQARLSDNDPRAARPRSLASRRS